MRRSFSLVVALAAVAAGSANAQGNVGLDQRDRFGRRGAVGNRYRPGFGNIAPTSFKTMAPASGGTFTVTGAASQPVSVSFTLPATLGNAAVAIGTWTGLSNTANTTAGASAHHAAGQRADAVAERHRQPVPLDRCDGDHDGGAGGLLHGPGDPDRRVQLTSHRRSPAWVCSHGARA